MSTHLKTDFAHFKWCCVENKYVDKGITVAGLSPTELWLLCARVLQLLRAVQGEHTGLLHVGTGSRLHQHGWWVVTEVTVWHLLSYKFNLFHVLCPTSPLP